MKTLSSTLSKQKNKLHTDKAWAHLFIVQITSTEALYLTNHSEQIAYDSHLYKPFPVSVGDIVEDSKGNLSSIPLTVSNINRMMMAYMETEDALLGNEVKIYLVNKVDTSVVINLGTYEILEASADQNVASFILGHYNFFILNFPRNRFIRSRCRWVYKSDQCKYDAGIATCDKTLEGAIGCTMHSDGSLGALQRERFGGFPGIPAGQLRLN